MLELTRAEAGRLMQAAQGLLDPPGREPGLADLRATVERLGAVQIDTISVVQRSQYLVLWSRLGAYDPVLLDRLLYPERATFEYWGHAASILPIADYPYYRPRMIHYREHMWTGMVRWVEQNPGVLQDTLARVAEQGPMSSGQFERPPDARRHGPWDWFGPKSSRRALEALYTMGELMVHSRRAGQKLYDLRERVLAEAFPKRAPTDGDLPPEPERRRHLATRTLAALGVVTPGWLHDYFRLAPNGHRRAEATALLDGMVAEGRAVPARIAGLREPAYVAAERRADLERVRGQGAIRTTLLSPFDNLIWHRDRTRALFGYEVHFEAYVVPEKRRYGYYCLAILHRGRIVGRADLKSERAAGQLRARGLWIEPGVEPDPALVEGLAGALQDLARFVGLEAVAVERAEPPDLAPRLAECVQ